MVWGDKNVVADAAACCASCEAHATAATAEGRTACNAWVFCGDAKACGSKLGHCWLKHTQDPSLPGHASHMWTAGAILPPGKTRRSTSAATSSDCASTVQRQRPRVRHVLIIFDCGARVHAGTGALNWTHSE